MGLDFTTRGLDARGGSYILTSLFLTYATAESSGPMILASAGCGLSAFGHYARVLRG